MRVDVRTIGALCILIVSTFHATATDVALSRFTSIKQTQVREYAQALPDKLPSIVWSFFDAVRVEDWETSTNLAARLILASGRYATAAADNDSLAAALHSAVWPPIAEVIGANEQFHNWDNRLLHRFGKDIINSIPKAGIYFGGTDAGRFIISALCTSQPDGDPFFTLTQNQLADQAYLDYLRKMYGGKITLPSEEDVRDIFNQYLAEAQRRLKEGLLKPGENVRMVNNRVQVSGHVAVMEINARLARLIVDNNPNHEVYVEESFPLDWMYPRLSPHKLIFKLESKPLNELDTETLQQDHDYWRTLLSELIGKWLSDETPAAELCNFVTRIYQRKDYAEFKGDLGFAKNSEAQTCFSKLRSAQAALYAWRATNAAENTLKLRMQQAAENAYRQAYALCPTLPETISGYTSLLLQLNRPDEAFLLAKTSLRLDPDSARLQSLVRTLNAHD